MIVIKDIIKSNGLTIEEVAIKMGIKRESLSRAINGNPTVDTLRRIADAIGVPVSSFFDDSENNKSVFCPTCGSEIIIEVKKK